jgi:hypothetical protein
MPATNRLSYGATQTELLILLLFSLLLIRRIGDNGRYLSPEKVTKHYAVDGNRWQVWWVCHGQGYQLSSVLTRSVYTDIWSHLIIK